MKVSEGEWLSHCETVNADYASIRRSRVILDEQEAALVQRHTETWRAYIKGKRIKPESTKETS